jgi:hypothetical protein
MYGLNRDTSNRCRIGIEKLSQQASGVHECAIDLYLGRAFLVRRPFLWAQEQGNVQLERLLPLSRYHWPAWTLPNGGWGKQQWAGVEGVGARVAPIGRRQRQQGRATAADLQVRV